MIKFFGMGKLKAAVAVVIFCKYTLWGVFFILQGKAISLALGKPKARAELIYTLLGYILVKIIVMLCDILNYYLIEAAKNTVLQKEWRLRLPQRIYRDSQDSKSKINVLFFDYLPKLFELETAIIRNRVTICLVFSLTMIAFIYSGFTLGILALAIVFFLNYLSKNIFLKKINDSLKESNEEKVFLLSWVEQYFSAFREVSKNWPSTAKLAWPEKIYEKYFRAKRNQNLYYLYRNLLSQGLVELPFLLNTTMVIVSVYNHYLTLTQLFMWVGFSQFMIEASNAYLENKMNKQQLSTLMQQANHIINFYKEPGPQVVSAISKDKRLLSEVTMRDGINNRLALSPGLYPVKGGNGSGKSTLINIILGYERRAYKFENANLSALLANINQQNTRIIERETVIFACFDDFNSQICGPDKNSAHWRSIINQAMNTLLPPNIARAWMTIFISLEQAFTFRADRTLSSGEKVMLSIMRFFYSWKKEVDLLIIDECDSFFDKEKKKLFMQTVMAIANHMAVYLVCHGSLFDKIGSADQGLCSSQVT